MNTTLKIFLLCLLVLQIILILFIVKKKRLTNKYATFWLLLVIIMIFLVLFPSLLFKVTSLLGFETTSNLVFLLGIFFLFYTTFIITTSVSVQKEKIKILTEELAILREKIESNHTK